MAQSADGLPELSSALIKRVAVHFCNLSPVERIPILESAEALMGRGVRARLFAFGAGWKKRKVGLSRHIGDQLFSVVPPSMTEAERFELLAEYWQSCRVAKSDRIDILDLPPKEIRRRVEGFFLEHVKPSSFPRAALERYPWLLSPTSVGRVRVLNALLLEERTMALEHFGDQLIGLLHFSTRQRLMRWSHRFDLSNASLLVVRDPQTRIRGVLGTRRSGEEQRLSDGRSAEPERASRPERATRPKKRGRRRRKRA